MDAMRRNVKLCRDQTRSDDTKARRLKARVIKSFEVGR